MVSSRNRRRRLSSHGRRVRPRLRRSSQPPSYGCRFAALPPELRLHPGPAERHRRSAVQERPALPSRAPPALSSRVGRTAVLPEAARGANSAPPHHDRRLKPSPEAAERFEEEQSASGWPFLSLQHLLSCARDDYTAFFFKFSADFQNILLC